MHRRASLFAVLGILALSATAFAAPAKAPGVWATGQLERFDPAGKSVVIKQGNHEMTFTLASHARLMQGKNTIQPSDLSSDIGRKVKVRYHVHTGNKVADRIELTGSSTTSHSTSSPQHGSSTTTQSNSSAPIKK